jgi:carbon monoxide dehydrogenase subunit G
MKTYTTRFHVDVPPATVFAYMMDPSTVMPGMEKMEPVHETPERIGSVYRYEERFLGMRFTGLFVIVELVENERIHGEFSGGLEVGEGVWSFAPADGGTDVRVESRFRLRIPLVGRPAAALMMRFQGTSWVPILRKEMEAYGRRTNGPTATTKTPAKARARAKTAA